MNAALLDTHVWAWSLIDPPNLKRNISDLLVETETVVVSSATIYEMTHKARIGKWRQIEADAPRLLSIAKDLSQEVAPLSGAMMSLAGQLAWAHRDPFDRMIAATAIVLDLPLVSADTTFDTCPRPIRRIW